MAVGDGSLCGRAGCAPSIENDGATVASVAVLGRPPSPTVASDAWCTCTGWCTLFRRVAWMEEALLSTTSFFFGSRQSEDFLLGKRVSEKPEP